ncbi:hypothetical protein D3C76_1746070 [compost metagenome]
MHSYAIEISGLKDALADPQMAIREENNSQPPDSAAVLLNKQSKLISRTGLFQAI